MNRYWGMNSADGRAVKDIAYRSAIFGESVTTEQKKGLRITQPFDLFGAGGV